MKLWIDDIRPAPEGYIHVKTVNQAIHTIIKAEKEQFYFRHLADEFLHSGDNFGAYQNAMNMYHYRKIELIDIDHDAGEYAIDGGDYIKLLDWLEGTGRDYPIYIHSMNPVGIENMRRIIERNGWTEIK